MVEVKGAKYCRVQCVLILFSCIIVTNQHTIMLAAMVVMADYCRMMVMADYCCMLVADNPLYFNILIPCTARHNSPLIPLPFPSTIVIPFMLFLIRNRIG